MTEIVVHEVGMHDGLQFEKQTISTEQKIRWLEASRILGRSLPGTVSRIGPIKAQAPQGSEPATRKSVPDC